MLNIINISKIYYGLTNHLALDDFSYSFDCKGVYYIKGKNGSGKSTLLKIIANKLSSSGGKVYLNGDANPEYIKENVFYLDYENMIFTMTVKENIDLINNPRMSLEELDEVLTKLELIDKKKLKVKQLSGGERKRFSIALAIYQGKNILLLDEPTSNLDKENSEKLYKIIEELGKDKLVIFTSHDEDKIPSDIKYTLIDIEKDGKDLVESEEQVSHTLDNKKECGLNLLVFLKRQSIFHYLLIFVATVLMFLPTFSVFLQKDTELSRLNNTETKININEVLVTNYDKDKVEQSLNGRFDFRDTRIEDRYFNTVSTIGGSSYNFRRISSLLETDLNPDYNYLPSQISNNTENFDSNNNLKVVIGNVNGIIEGMTFYDQNNNSPWLLTDATYEYLMVLSLQNQSSILVDSKSYDVVFSDSLNEDEYYCNFTFENNISFNMMFSGISIGIEQLTKVEKEDANLGENQIMISSSSSFFLDIRQKVSNDYHILTFVDGYHARRASLILENNDFDIFSPILNSLRVEENSYGYNSTLIMTSSIVFILISILLSVIYVVMRYRSKLGKHLIAMGHSKKKSSSIETMMYLPIYILSSVIFISIYIVIYGIYAPMQLVPLAIMGIIFAVGLLIQLCSIIIPHFIWRKKHD